MKLDPLRVKMTTAPTVEPLAVNEVKEHLRIDHADEDDYLERLIEQARTYCEDVAQRALITRTYTVKLDWFPPSVFWLPYPPLLGVTSIKYTDDQGSQSTLSAANYTVDTHQEPGRVALKSTATWPSVTLADINGVEIIYTAGYGATAVSVPARYKQAMLLLVAHYYENREAVIVAQGVNLATLPLGIDALLLADRGGWN